MKKIGIVTFNDAYNYGAMLQAYGLVTFLNQENYKAEIINYENIYFKNQYEYSYSVIKRRGIKNKLKVLYNKFFRRDIYKRRKLRLKRFLSFIQASIPISAKFSYDKKEFFNNNYDVFIAGSDQIWNLGISEYDYFYFLDFVDDNRKKLTYAASFGGDDFSSEDKEIFKKYISAFSSVLVREESGKKLLEDLEIESSVVLDPTFLLQKEDWIEFSKKSELSFKGKKYVLIYTIAEPIYLLDVALRYADGKGLNVFILSDKKTDITYKGRKIRSLMEMGPYEFISCILSADKIFTTSFHGMALSVNLNKDFYYERCKAKINYNTRLENLSDALDLGAREISDRTLPEGEIDWEHVNKKLAELRQNSIDLLINSLNAL